MTEICNAKLDIRSLDKQEELPMEILLLAEPCPDKIEKSLQSGRLYVAVSEADVIGAVIINSAGKRVAEIANIAVKEEHQGKGIGKQLLNHAIEVGRREGFEKIIVGTANSSVLQLGFYQKLGFEIEGIEKNFFLINYDEPIYENDIQCKHMISLSMNLHT